MKRLVGIFASLALWLGCATTGVPGKADVAAEAPAAEAPAAEAPAAEAADSASTEDHAIAKASGPPLEPFSLKLASGGLYDAGAAPFTMTWRGKALSISPFLQMALRASQRFGLMCDPVDTSFLFS